MTPYYETDQAACLKRNPFFILNLPVTATRREITDAVEEMSFLLDSDDGLKAQREILTPDRRLLAELNWFLDLDTGRMEQVRASIEHGTEIEVDGLGKLSRLNALVYNLSLSQADDLEAAENMVIGISGIFDHLTAAELAAVLCGIHDRAGLPEASENEITAALQKKREEIGRLLTAKAEKLREKDYIRFHTELAKRSYGQGQADDQLILSDLIDRYELKMQPRILEQVQEIKALFEQIKEAPDQQSIRAVIELLPPHFQKWLALACPIQLKSQSLGFPDQTSEAMASEVRNLAVWLNNEKTYSRESVLLLETTKQYFSQVHKLDSDFEQDLSILAEIVQNNKTADTMLTRLGTIKTLAQRVKLEGTNRAIDRLILAVREINTSLLISGLEEEQIATLREIACGCCRDAAISLNNENKQPDQAYILTMEMIRCFGDLDRLAPQLAQDVLTLRKMLPVWQLKSLETYEPAHSVVKPKVPEHYDESNKKAKERMRIGLAVILFGVVAAFVIFVVWEIARPGKEPDAPAPQTSQEMEQKETAPQEKLFQTSLAVGEEVYASISSIFPTYGIYTEGDSFYSSFVCECQTNGGQRIWVSMTVSEYRQYFDPGASSSVNNSVAEEIKLPYPKKIHGTVTTADNILADLPDSLGVNKVLELNSVD